MTKPKRAAARADAPAGNAGGAGRRSRASGEHSGRGFEDPDLQLAFREALHRYARRPYVTGVSIGSKIRRGRCLEETVVRIHVREKIPKAYLRRAELFPKEIEGVPIDVVQRVYAAHLAKEERWLRQRWVDPIQPGVGIARADGDLGTFGCVVFEESTGRPALLSAAHVLAGAPKSVAGDPILQPGPGIGGKVGKHTVGELRGWIWNGLGDAAYALLTGQRRVNPLFLLNPLRLQGVRKPRKDDVLVKSSLKTGVTRGRVESVGEIEVSYGAESPGSSVSVVKRLMQGFEIRTLDPANPENLEISEKGDSGAVWLDPETGEGVGLHVGGEPWTAPREEERALACCLSVVLDELDLSLVPTAKTPSFPFTEEDARLVEVF
jgi:hypothetical protein